MRRQTETLLVTSDPLPTDGEEISATWNSYYKDNVEGYAKMVNIVFSTI